MIKSMHFCLLFLLVITVKKSFCQHPADFAVKLGYVNSRYTGNNLPGKKINSVSGVNIGGSMLMPIKNKVKTQIDLLLISNGAKLNVVGDAFLTHYYLYLESPLLIKYMLLDKPKTPFVLLGPSVRLKIVAISETGVLDNIKNIDTGLNVGIGYESRNIIFDIRYYNGLVNIDKLAEGSKVLHSYFSVSLALKLRKNG